MGFFDSIWSGIKNVTHKVVSGAKSVGNFIKDKAGQILNGAISTGKAVGGFVIDKGGKAINKIVDVSKGIVNKVESTVKGLNPFNNLGFILLGGLGLWAAVEFSKTNTASNLAARVPLAVP